MYYTNDIVNIIDVNRVSGICVLNHNINGIMEGELSIQCYNIFSMSHDIFCFLIGKIKDILNHLCFIS